jgi:hypothetical protein
MAIRFLGYCGASLESWRRGLQLCTQASIPGPLFHGQPWERSLHFGLVGIYGHVGVCLGTDLVRQSPTGKISAEGDFALALESGDMLGEICSHCCRRRSRYLPRRMQRGFRHVRQ